MPKILLAKVAEEQVEAPLTACSSAAMAKRVTQGLGLPIDQDMQQMTEQLLTESQSILQDAMGFADLEPEHIEKDEPPSQWVEQMGRPRAKRKMRLSKMALLPRREAPVGLEQARALAVGIIASKAREKGGTKILNVQFVTVPAPPVYPKVILEKKK